MFFAPFLERVRQLTLALILSATLLLLVAAVVAAPGTAPVLAELREFVAQSLDATAAPRELHLVAELPRRGIGKLDRRALRERYG